MKKTTLIALIVASILLLGILLYLYTTGHLFGSAERNAIGNPFVGLDRPT